MTYLKKAKRPISITTTLFIILGLLICVYHYLSPLETPLTVAYFSVTIPLACAAVYFWLKGQNDPAVFHENATIEDVPEEIKTDAKTLSTIIRDSFQGNPPTDLKHAKEYLNYFHEKELHQDHLKKMNESIKQDVNYDKFLLFYETNIILSNFDKINKQTK